MEPMSGQPPGTGSDPFGYPQTSANRASSDRDALIRQAGTSAEAREALFDLDHPLGAATERLWANEAELARLKGDLDAHAEVFPGIQLGHETVRSYQAKLQSALRRQGEIQVALQAVWQRQAELRAAFESASAASLPLRPGQPDHDMVKGEVVRILEAAEESAAQIVGLACKAAEQRMVEAIRRLANAQRSAAQFEQQARAAEQRMEEAQRSAGQIVERASVLAEERIAAADRRMAEAENLLAEAERRWRELRASITSFATWKDSVGPFLGDFHDRVEEIRARIEEIPARLRSAFSPLAQATASTDEGIAQLQRQWTPPPIPGPTTWLAQEGSRQPKGASAREGLLTKRTVSDPPATGARAARAPVEQPAQTESQDNSAEDLRRGLLGGGVAGIVSHPMDNVLWRIGLLCDGDPQSQFGLSGLTGFSRAEVLAMVARASGFQPDPNDRWGPVRVDPERVLRACEAVGDRLALACDRDERIVLATGHPTGLMQLYTKVGRELVRRGVSLLRPADGVSWREGGRHREIRYVHGVAVLTDRASALHTHSAEPMERMLEEVRPDLVFADHGWAGAAIEAGIETVSIADVNDPALIVARELGRTEVVIVMDDNVRPDAYWPCFQAITARLPEQATI
jgi:hypothetical protein